MPILDTSVAAARLSNGARFTSETELLSDTDTTDARDNSTAPCEHHSVLVVPMLRDGARSERSASCAAKSGRFDGDQIGLVQTFADQAVIAIENVRLFNETKEALRAADGDGRDPARDQQLADGRAAGVRRHREQRAAPVRHAIHRGASVSTVQRALARRPATPGGLPERPGKRICPMPREATSTSRAIVTGRTRAAHTDMAAAIDRPAH